MKFYILYLILLWVVFYFWFLSRKLKELYLFYVKVFFEIKKNLKIYYRLDFII